MANSDIINLIITTFANAFTYLMPIVGIMAGINWITGFLFNVTFGAEKRSFGSK